eukprot:4450966-Amphidinium_carterae.1
MKEKGRSFEDPWFEATSLDICECRSMTSLTSQDIIRAIFGFRSVSMSIARLAHAHTAAFAVKYLARGLAGCGAMCTMLCCFRSGAAYACVQARMHCSSGHQMRFSPPSCINFDDDGPPMASPSAATNVKDFA